MCQTHDSAIAKLSATQISQGTLLKTINQKYDRLEGHMVALCFRLNVTVPPPPQVSQSDQSPASPPAPPTAPAPTLQVPPPTNSPNSSLAEDKEMEPPLDEEHNPLTQQPSNPSHGGPEGRAS